MSSFQWKDWCWDISHSCKEMRKVTETHSKLNSWLVRGCTSCRKKRTLQHNSMCYLLHSSQASLTIFSSPLSLFLSTSLHCTFVVASAASHCLTTFWALFFFSPSSFLSLFSSFFVSLFLRVSLIPETILVISLSVPLYVYTSNTIQDLQHTIATYNIDGWKGERIVLSLSLSVCLLISVAFLVSPFTLKSFGVCFEYFFLFSLLPLPSLYLVLFLSFFRCPLFIIFFCLPLFLLLHFLSHSLASRITSLIHFHRCSKVFSSSPCTSPLFLRIMKGENNERHPSEINLHFQVKLLSTEWATCRCRRWETLERRKRVKKIVNQHEEVIHLIVNNSLLFVCMSLLSLRWSHIYSHITFHTYTHSPFNLTLFTLWWKPFHHHMAKISYLKLFFLLLSPSARLMVISRCISTCFMFSSSPSFHLSRQYCHIKYEGDFIRVTCLTHSGCSRWWQCEDLLLLE